MAEPDRPVGGSSDHVEKQTVQLGTDGKGD